MVPAGNFDVELVRLKWFDALVARTDWWDSSLGVLNAVSSTSGNAARASLGMGMGL